MPDFDTVTRSEAAQIAGCPVENVKGRLGDDEEWFTSVVPAEMVRKLYADDFPDNDVVIMSVSHRQFWIQIKEPS